MTKDQIATGIVLFIIIMILSITSVKAQMHKYTIRILNETYVVESSKTGTDIFISVSKYKPISGPVRMMPSGHMTYDEWHARFPNFEMPNVPNYISWTDYAQTKVKQKINPTSKCKHVEGDFKKWIECLGGNVQ